ncbi:MAG TPA: glycosyltransferase family 4 protein [Phycisphaerae bacterium]|nr:glycosyltransferase family 4 protein [Phycisphaerae bacterium]
MGRLFHRLTFVSDAPHFGGAERYIVAMAQAARRRGIEPRIWWLPPPAGRCDVFNWARDSGLNVTRMPFKDRRSFVGLVRAFVAMRSRQQPDGLVVNASGRRRYWLLPLLARLAGIPCVWVHQMIDARDHRHIRPSRFGGRFEGLHLWRIPQTIRHMAAAAAATAVVTLNAEDRERIIRWHRVPRRKIHVVPHGVDLERFRFDPAGRSQWRRQWNLADHETGQPMIVGTAGRLVSGKGIELLLEAAVILKQRGRDFRLVIAGDGPRRVDFMVMSDRLGVADRTIWAGLIENMPAFYSALDVFALCSATESFGLALAEAMACERVVVGTPTSGARDQIDHGRTGWQLRGFEPADLADMLENIIHRQEQAVPMGRAARESVHQQFSIGLTLDRTLRALGQTVGAQEPSGALGANLSLAAGPMVEDCA